MSEDKKVMTPEFQVAFEKVFNPGQNKQGKDSYSVTMMFPKDTDLSKLKEAAQKVIKEKWGENKPKKLKSPFKDADSYEDSNGDILKDKYEFMEGHVIVDAKTGFAPGLVNEKKQKIIDENEFYSGCFAIATVVPFAYDQDGNKGVSFGLRNIMKLRDGDKLTGGATAEQDFEEVEVSSTETISEEDLDL